MAKWGEGDPRWLVEERPDAKNVNNWHWSEKNASHWSIEKFKELFTSAKVITDFAECTITEVSKSEGDATVNNRKAKLIFFYEWVLELKWTGKLTDGETLCKGTIEIPNLSEEHEIKDVDINIHLETTGPESDVIKDMLRSTGEKVIRDHLQSYINSLKEEFSKGLILPTKDKDVLNDKATADICRKKTPQEEKVASVKSSSLELDVCDLTTTESFKCTAEELYRALTSNEMMQAFTRGNCVFEDKDSTRFKLFDGNVEGHFVKLVPGKHIHQKWRFRSWPAGHYSDVFMELVQKNDSTELHFKQQHVPKSEVECTREGWKRFYWDSIKQTFGFGAFLL